MNMSHGAWIGTLFMIDDNVGTIYKDGIKLRKRDLMESEARNGGFYNVLIDSLQHPIKILQINVILVQILLTIHNVIAFD